MADQSGPHRSTMPSPVRMAFWLVVVQAAIGALSALSLLLTVNEEKDRRAIENEGLLQFLVYFSFLVAIVLATCAYLITRRDRWVRPTVIGIQAIGIAGSLISIISGAPTGFVGILFALGVIVMLNHDEAKAWFVR